MIATLLRYTLLELRALGIRSVGIPHYAGEVDTDPPVAQHPVVIEAHVRHRAVRLGDVDALNDHQDVVGLGPLVNPGRQALQPHEISIEEIPELVATTDVMRLAPFR